MSTILLTNSPSMIRRITLPIEGFGCGGGGALTLERVLASLPGVKRSYANPATEMAYIEFDETQCSAADVVKAVEKAGLRVLVSDRSPRGLERHVR